MDRPLPRLTSVMGVARALLGTVAVDEAVEVLIIEFGWDITFQALALLRGDDAAEAFGRAWEHLATHRISGELSDPGWDVRSWLPEH